MKLSRLFQIQWGNVFKLSRELSNRSNRTTVAVFLDFLSTYKTRGASWWNYMNFGFHFQRDPQVRDSFATEYKDNVYMSRQCNSPEALSILMDKGLFNQHYQEFLGREYIDLRLVNESEFQAFLEGHDEVVVKPLFDAGGLGVEKLAAQKPRDFSQSLLRKKNFLSRKSFYNILKWRPSTPVLLILYAPALALIKMERLPFFIWFYVLEEKVPLLIT